jgi:hypothetical protein
MDYNRFQPSGPNNKYNFDSSEQSRIADTRNPLSMPPMSGMGGLAETAAPKVSPLDQYYNNKRMQEEATFQQTQDDRDLKLTDRQDPWVTGGFAALGAIGNTASILGTLKLQNERRKGLRQNRKAAAQFNDNTEFRSKSFNAGYSAELNDNKRTV